MFNSIEFPIFFASVFIAYWVIPHRFRNLLLLATSLFFYAYEIPEYLIVLAATIIISYGGAILIEKTNADENRKALLAISIMLMLAIIFLFKYFDFFSLNLEKLAKDIGWNYSHTMLDIVLPIGLSFYVLQGIGYVIDVYRVNLKAEQNFLNYSLFISFFPQLVAGPIERAKNILPQLNSDRFFSYTEVTNGFKIMLWGFFKKFVIADNIAFVVNPLFNNPESASGPALLAGAFLFGFQIYADFSGYSDIAIGAAQALGIKLMKNFDRPFLSKSIPEFWKRWHISLFSWLKDYVYIPLGGNRVSEIRTYLNIMAVFIISGLWHGAEWTFILWGFVSGIQFLIWRFGERAMESIAARIKWIRKLLKSSFCKKVIRIALILITFTSFCTTLIIFRAKSTGDAFKIIEKVATDTSSFYNMDWVSKLSDKTFQLVVSVAAIIFLLAIEIIQEKTNVIKYLAERPRYIRWILYTAFIMAILTLSTFKGTNEFIYFRF